MSFLRNQRGVIGLMAASALVLVVGTTLIIKQLEGIQSEARRIKSTAEALETLRKSVINFAAVNGRLPCPASGAADAGVAVPNVASAVCTNPNGTVPWNALGLAKSTAFDGWNRKISYRVYTGASGVTVAGGANMSDCDLVPATPVDPLGPNFQCTAAHTTSGQPGSPIGFLSAAHRPGLSVSGTALPAAVTQVAFVLISHGQSGAGAWLEGGARQALPAAGNAAEFGNTLAVGPFFRQLYSDKSVAVTANNHFDDELIYMTIADLINGAGRGPRRWAGVAATPIVGAPPAISFDNATLALDSSVSPVGLAYSAGVITLSPPIGTPMVISTGAGYVIARNPASTAIGVCSTTPPCTNSQLAAPQYLSFSLTTKTAQKVSLGLLNYGATESFKLSFRRLGVPVGVTVVSAFPEATTGFLPGVAFDEVIITPVASSTFYVQSIRFCDAASPC